MPYALDDTIVAVVTARGSAGVGVVRLSGPAAPDVCAAVFRPSSGKALTDTPPRTVRRGRVMDGDTPVDDVLACYFAAPASYTGDPVIELSAHGNPVILDTIVRLCCARGARPALPGEFTFRAFAHGKLDLSAAEAVAALIAAKTARAATAALRQLDGGLARAITAWRQDLVGLLASLELGIDHGDEHSHADFAAGAPARLAGLIDGMDRLIATAAKGMALRDGVRVCIAGSPNAGKSSLLNALLARDRAIVSDVPGTTRDIIEESLDIRGVPVLIVDTAGLRAHAADILEQAGHARTVAALRTAAIVLVVTDASRPPSPEDAHVAAAVGEHAPAARLIAVANKCDLPGAAPAAGAVAVSAATGAGIPGLEAVIADAAGAATPDTDDPLIATARHRDALTRARTAVAQARGRAGAPEDDVLVAEHLREALRALDEITGAAAPDEILDAVFSRFCVGK